MKKVSLFQFINVVYDNEGTGNNGGAPGGAGASGAGTGTNPNPESGDPNNPAGGSGTGAAKRTYSEDEFQKAVEAERKRAQDQTRQTIQSLETLKQNQQLSEQEKARLAAQIDELNRSLLSKEELAKKDRERLVHEHKSQLDNVTKERDTWRTRFEETQIVRAISDAAIKGDAFNANLIVPLLRPNAALVEGQVDGKPTGQFAVKLNMTVSENGVDKVLSLTPEEAIKVMKDRPDEYGQLFKGNLNGGVGGNPSSGRQNPKNLDIANMTPEEYSRVRHQVLGKPAPKGK